MEDDDVREDKLDYSSESDGDFIVEMDSFKVSEVGAEEDEYSLDFNHNDGNRIVILSRRNSLVLIIIASFIEIDLFVLTFLVSFSLKVA
jgi:hypothetical protein